MIVGSSTYGSIFGYLVVLIEKMNHKEVKNQRMLEQSSQWAKVRKLDEEIRNRVFAYFGVVIKNLGEFVDEEILDGLPLSLKTEISVYMHQDLINNSRLFNDPGFMLGLIRNLKPRFYMAGDMIIRQGEYAEEFYLIRNGSVEVLATDGETCIAIMNQGAFFGEIGILIQDRRSVSVKARTATLLSYIKKGPLLNVLRNFPEHTEFLRKVAMQRLSTTHPSDLNLSYDLFESSSSSSEDLESEKPQYEELIKIEEEEIQPKETLKTFICKNCFAQGIIGGGPVQYIIEPFSRIFNIWSISISLACFYYIFLVPVSIAFEYNPEGFFQACDYLSYAIYLCDIFIAINSATMNEFGNINRKSTEIRTAYLNKYFILDLISIIPADYIALAYHSFQYISAYWRIVRLFKILRIVNLFKLIGNHIGYSSAVSKLMLYFVIYLVMNHYFACGFFYVSRIQYENYPDERWDGRTYFSTYGDRPWQDYYDKFTEISVFHQYIEVWYWSLSSFGSLTYGDHIPCTAAEKFFSVILMVSSKFFLAFIVAEAANAVTNYHAPYTEHLTKINLIQEWMGHLKLSRNLKNRVMSYYSLLWKKLKGHDDSLILKELPESLRTDIDMALFSCFAGCDLFPKEDQGAILAIVRVCKIMMCCKGEEIVTQGEVGLEMYFVMEGSVEIATKTGVILATLTVGQPFGEMALLKPMPSLRGASVIAKTDVTLAVLSLQDFSFVMANYPEFSRKVREKAVERETMNQKAFDMSLSSPQPEPYSSPIDPSSPEHSSPSDPLSSNTDSLKKSEDLSNLTMTPGSASFIKVKPSLSRVSERWLTKENYLKFQHLIFWITLYNTIYIPLQVGYEWKFEPWAIILECATIIIYSIYIYSLILVYILMKNPDFTLKFPHYSRYSRSGILLKAIFFTVVAFPFAFIFSFGSTSAPGGVIKVLSYLRLLNLRIFFVYSSRYKKRRITWLHVIRLFEALIAYMIMSHIVACLFIAMSTIESDQDRSWLRRIPAPQPTGVRTADSEPLTESTIYIHALYWTFVTTSNIGNGDVTAITYHEKLFNCIVVICTTFPYAIIFGNITTLVASFTSKLRRKMNQSYSYVINFMTKKRIFHLFEKEINSYYNYIWDINKGIEDSEILNELPANLLSDIQMERYYSSIKDSLLFKDNGVINLQLARSVFRLMKISYFIEGDYIYKQYTSKFHFVIDGSVDLLYSDGTVRTLHPGSFFGRDIAEQGGRVVANRTCKIGTLDHEEITILTAAYTHIGELIHTVGISSEAYIKKEKSKFMLLKVVHLVCLIYSSFFIPMQLSFKIEMSIALLVVEILIFVESLVFFVTRMIKRKKYKREYMICDLLAMSPFNIVLGRLEIYEPIYIITPLRLLRVFALHRFKSLVDNIEFKYRNLTGFLTALKNIIFLVWLWHWSSSFWYYTNLWIDEEGDLTWVDYHNLHLKTLGKQYLMSLYFTMNFVTSLGYGDMFACTDIERLSLCTIILVGDALFAIAFGMMASLAQNTESEYSDYLEKIEKARSSLSTGQLPKQLVKKLEQYYAFSWAITQTSGPINYKELYLHLPVSLVEKIMYTVNKKLLSKVPLLMMIKSEILIETISTKLQPSIFMPFDYLIYKNDIGEEMYFILEGNVHVISPDNKKILKTLGRGDYVGEMALLTDTRRACSVICNSFCLVYVLSKSDFDEILLDFPDVRSFLQAEGQKRRQEIGNLDRETINEGAVEEEQPSPIFPMTGFSKTISAVAGIRNMQSDLVKQAISQLPAERRRPHVTQPPGRRVSMQAPRKPFKKTKSL